MQKTLAKPSSSGSQRRILAIISWVCHWGILSIKYKFIFFFRKNCSTRIEVHLSSQQFIQPFFPVPWAMEETIFEKELFYIRQPQTLKTHNQGATNSKKYIFFYSLSRMALMWVFFGWRKARGYRKKEKEVPKVNKNAVNHTCQVMSHADSFLSIPDKNNVSHNRCSSQC